jgi:uncharacterized damage-inducible protein DinB
MSDRRQAIQQHLRVTRDTVLDVFHSLEAGDWERPIASSEGAWTARQTLAHLVAAEIGQRATGQRMLTGEARLGEGFSLDFWNQRQIEKRKDQAPDALLDELAASRQKLLTWIEGLTEADLDKSGQHGRGDVITVEQLCYRIGEHETDHAMEIRQALDR